MKKSYFLPLLKRALFLFISLFLQNCGGLVSPPIQGEQEPTETIEQEGEQGRRKKPRIEIEEEQERNIIEQEPGINSYDIFPPEIWQHIFSYLNFEDILLARAVNKDWNELITGYRETGVAGVENKPSYNNTGGWVKEKEVNLKRKKLKRLVPATISSFAFHRLMGHVKNLPHAFWPYLKGTQVQTLDLNRNQIGGVWIRKLAKALPGTQVHTLYLQFNGIGNLGVRKLAKALPGTQVHTLYLGYNDIEDVGIIELAKALPETQVHILYLNGNQIRDVGTRELAKALPETQVHTLYLSGNQIRDVGTRELAKALPATQVHTVDLSNNYIGDVGAQELAKALPGTRVHTVNLSSNRIGAQGAIEFAKHLQGTCVHTVDLSINNIKVAMQQLLGKQYPHIKWTF